MKVYRKKSVSRRRLKNERWGFLALVKTCNRNKAYSLAKLEQ